MNIEKSDFIEFSLQPFIQRLDDSVESLTYEYDDGTAASVVKALNDIERA